MVVLGMIVLIVGVILIFIKNKEKPLSFEYSMETADYDKVTGKVSQVDRESPSKYIGMLQFVTKPNSKDMAAALVCAEQIAKVEKVDLYMSDMGHGSQPPILSKGNIPANLKNHSSSEIGFGCLNITSMQLFMPGNWQVRLFYNDGKVGLFHIDVDD